MLEGREHSTLVLLGCSLLILFDYATTMLTSVGLVESVVLFSVDMVAIMVRVLQMVEQDNENYEKRIGS